MVLALARSPERPGKLLLLPALRADDDFDFETSPLPEDALLRVDDDLDINMSLLEDALADDAGSLVAVAEGLPATTVLGLFCPVLLVVVVGAIGGLSTLLSRCDWTEESEGSRDIIGGLGGRADVNFWEVLAEREDGTVESALVLFFLFLSRPGEGLGVSFFSKTGESLSLLPLVGMLRRVLIIFNPPALDFFEV